MKTTPQDYLKAASAQLWPMLEANSPGTLVPPQIQRSEERARWSELTTKALELAEERRQYGSDIINDMTLEAEMAEQSNKSLVSRIGEIAGLLDKTINQLLEDCGTASFEQAQAYRSHVGVLVKFQEAAGLVVRASPKEKKPRSMPTKEALAEALSKRYGGQAIPSNEIIDVRDFTNEGDANTTIHFQAWRNAMVDWYEATVNSAGQVDHTSITQLPF